MVLRLSMNHVKVGRPTWHPIPSGQLLVVGSGRRPALPSVCL